MIGEFFYVVLQLLYFMLPAEIANMTPVFVKKLPLLNKPIDGGKRFRGFRILGPNKTWRGLVFGCLAGILTIWLQQQLDVFPFFRSLSIVNYSSFPWLLGFLLALGALIGDSIKSFFKRQQNIQSGKSWFPFDQLDYVVGAIICSAPIMFIGWTNTFILLIVNLALHPLVNYIGFLLKIKKNKF